MIRGITFGAFDLFHAGHILMLAEAKTVCDHLTVCIQKDPSIDRPTKNHPIQNIVERQIQVKACRYVDDILVYERESELRNILRGVQWDIRIIGEEYYKKHFTGRKEFGVKKIHWNKRTHEFSSTELRNRVCKDK